MVLYSLARFEIVRTSTLLRSSPEERIPARPVTINVPVIFVRSIGVLWNVCIRLSDTP